MLLQQHTGNSVLALQRTGGGGGQSPGAIIRGRGGRPCHHRRSQIAARPNPRSNRAPASLL